MTAVVKALLLCDHNHKKSFSVWTVIEIAIATRYFKSCIIKCTVQKFYGKKYQRIGLRVWSSGIETNWQGLCCSTFILLSPKLSEHFACPCNLHRFKQPNPVKDLNFFFFYIQYCDLKSTRHSLRNTRGTCIPFITLDRIKLLRMSTVDFSLDRHQTA